MESQEGVGTQFTFALPVLERLVVDPSDSKAPSGSTVEATRPSLLVFEQDATIVSMIKRTVKGFDVVQIRDSQTLPEMSLKYHPRAIIHNIRPGHRTIDDRLLMETSIPIIHCSLPSAAWMAEDLAIAGYLSKPIASRSLLDAIDSTGSVHDILVIDDDRDFVLLVERILQSSGKSFETRRAYDATQGFAMLLERLPDLVLLDLIMPGQDGKDFLAQMRADTRLAGVPVILITSNDVGRTTQPESRITIQPRDGLHPIEVLNCLNSIVNNIKPRYD